MAFQTLGFVKELLLLIRNHVFCNTLSWMEESNSVHPASLLLNQLKQELSFFLYYLQPRVIIKFILFIDNFPVTTQVQNLVFEVI